MLRFGLSRNRILERRDLEQREAPRRTWVRLNAADYGAIPPLRYNRYIVASLSTGSASSASGAPRGLRARRIGATIAAGAFLAATIASPLPYTGAFAADGDTAGFQLQTTQGFTVESGADPAIDLSASDVAEAVQADGTPAGAEYSLSDFLFKGSISWGGYRFTFYSQQVLPGGGLEIPGRHVNPAGYVSDADGYIVLAGSAPKGTVYDTPFGYQGKIYDRGTVGNHLDVYIR